VEVRPLFQGQAPKSEASEVLEQTDMAVVVSTQNEIGRCSRKRVWNIATHERMV